MKKNGLIELGGLLSEMNILPTDLGITSRQVTYWKNRKIFPFLTKEKRGLMNIPEALWLLIINELSNIGLDSKKLTRLSYDVWVKPYFEKYADQIFKKELTNNKYLNNEDKSWLEHYLQNDFIMESAFRKEINPFTDSIKTCLINKGNIVSLLYCPKKEEYCFNFNNIGLTSDLNNLFFGETLITIPLIPLLSKLIGIEIDKSTLDLDYLSAIENHIRRILFFDRPKFMEIALQEDGNHKIYTITEEHKKGEELAKFFLTNKLPLGAKVIIEPRAQGNYKITIKT
jgi:hypothetical protein